MKTCCGGMGNIIFRMGLFALVSRKSYFTLKLKTKYSVVKAQICWNVFTKTKREF